MTFDEYHYGTSDDGPRPLALPFKLLSTSARLPTKAHAGDAAFDLRTSETVWIQEGESTLIPTALAWEGPDGWYAQILTRSSHAQSGLFVIAGVIDSGYRSEWKVVMYNGSGGDACFEEGDKIAQFVLLPVPRCEIVPIESLGETERGVGGFGSSGP
jgi:dUTP pyrophosphatase